MTSQLTESDTAKLKSLSNKRKLDSGPQSNVTGMVLEIEVRVFKALTCLLLPLTIPALSSKFSTHQNAKVQHRRLNVLCRVGFMCCASGIRT